MKLTTRGNELVRMLKHAGEATAEELAERLGVTVSAVRQQLDVLAADGLVAWRPQARGRGRPAHVYRLTRAAEPLFPKAYGGLTNELLGYLAEADPALVDDIFDRRRQRRLEGAQARLAPLEADFAARVAELARILDEDGYLASFEARPDGTFRIVEHNCAVLDVAERYGQACSSEIAFLRQALPEARVRRVSHMIAGAHSCAYEVTPLP
ncbi:MAG TPA: helix-turn-helix domain-containing protein [Acidimicrobiales bacterium]|nr:helix-turn-helix domain-containing protein [Acidimicrobiales bacterium]